MDNTLDRLHDAARRALAALASRGFDQAQATASQAMLTELNIDTNRPALLRSTNTRRLALVGITDGRRAATEISDDSDAAIGSAVNALHADARAAPPDAAHGVSAGQRASIVQGPLACDTPLLADKVAELLEWREREVPTAMLKSGAAAHALTESVLLTSGGSAIDCRIGRHELNAVFNAREGSRSSSFNYAGGSTHDMGATPAQEQFGIRMLIEDVVRSVNAKPLSTMTAPFDGEVVLTPAAAASLLAWLLGQLGDERLLSGTSMLRGQVGQAIAAPALTLASRFDAPGIAAVSADGFLAPPVTVVDEGRLLTLTPSLYASRKLGLEQVPVAAAGGWAVPAGMRPWRELVAAVPRGALVARLSMGMPVANGDFAGVVKNSFLIEDGRLGAPLAETMISGNVARMLQDLREASAERIDTGDWWLPWLRVGGLHFS